MRSTLCSTSGPIEGREIQLEARKRPTIAAVERAKALQAPELHGGTREARRLIDRLTDQIKRLESTTGGTTR